MKKVNYKSTLDYYDGVQIFEARDQIGGRYLATLVNATTDNYCYLVVSVEPELLARFKSGNEELLQIIVESADRGWYLAECAGDLTAPLLLKDGVGEIPSKFLPNNGYRLAIPEDNPKMVELARSNADR